MSKVLDAEKLAKANRFFQKALDAEKEQNETGVDKSNMIKMAMNAACKAELEAFGESA